MTLDRYNLSMPELRRATSADLPFLLGLERRYSALGFVGTDSESLHNERMASSGASYLIVEDSGRPAGFVILCGLDSVNRCVELKRIMVDPPGKGVGSAVLRRILTMVFDEFSAHRIWLDVYEDNQRARSVYRTLGFVEEGTLRECIHDGGRFRSLVVMSILEPEYRRFA
jgi:RimJ/RimL family protein N-acetyltransferase